MAQLKEGAELEQQTFRKLKELGELIEDDRRHKNEFMKRSKQDTSSRRVSGIELDQEAIGKSDSQKLGDSEAMALDIGRKSDVIQEAFQRIRNWHR